MLSMKYPHFSGIIHFTLMSALKAGCKGLHRCFDNNFDSVEFVHLSYFITLSDKRVEAKPLKMLYNGKNERHQIQ
jgi:hypothetical protein